MEHPKRDLATDLSELIGVYGYKDLHTMLINFMSQDYTYLKIHFEDPNKQTIISMNPPLVSADILQSVEIKSEQVPKKRKYTKKASKVIEPIINSTPPVVVTESEIKDVIVTSPVMDRQYRDPKEMKAFQKAAEDAKKNENQAAGYQVTDILTKENLEKWIEQECRTYAWVAREKAGCPETQVAATAQMMGIKSKITKKRGIIMSGK
jgi:hypothetical protein